MTANKQAKEIREMLTNNCLYTYLVEWGTKHRIIDVRVHQGIVQVKRLEDGNWTGYMYSHQKIVQQ